MSARESNTRLGRFRLKLKLLTDDIVELKNVTLTTSVSHLKLLIEKQFGIPHSLQRLRYLDSLDLRDNTSLQHNDVVSGGTIRLSTWRTWHSLLCAAMTGTKKDLGQLDTSNWDKKRLWTFMYLAAFYGRFEMLLCMIENESVDVNETTQTGRTALHAAAYGGHWKCLCALLEKGADITITDNDGYTPLDLSKMGTSETCRDCEKSLNFCSWNRKKKELIKTFERKPSQKVLRFEGERRAHQFADSALRTWYTGEYAQMYMSRPPNPVSLAPQNKQFGVHMKESDSYLPPVKCESRHSGLSQTESDMRLQASGISGRDIKSGHDLDDIDNEQKANKQTMDQEWVDPVRAREIVPTGVDLIAYSENGLRRKIHIPVRAAPISVSLQQPRRMPTSCKFEKKRSDSRTDSNKSDGVGVTDGLDFRTWLRQKGIGKRKEKEESNKRVKLLEETAEMDKRRRRQEACEAFARWLQKKNSQPKSSRVEEETAVHRIRRRARHLTAVR